jgi:hypothetical protein
VEGATTDDDQAADAAASQATRSDVDATVVSSDASAAASQSAHSAVGAASARQVAGAAPAASLVTAVLRLTNHA